jgi:metal-sulfur cluster biosynthetic enzyme
MTTSAAVPPVIPREIWAALGTVRDPELDEPITELGFVRSAGLEGGRAEVELQLPTYFCAPNFAYLMVADAHDALQAVPGVNLVRVRLVDHFTADEINAGVAEDAGFTGSFPGLAEVGSDQLSQLRVTFQRKAHAAAQEVVAAGLLARGVPHEQLVGLRLGDPGVVSFDVPNSTESDPTESDPTERKPTENIPTQNKPTENKPTESIWTTALDRLRRRRDDLGLPSGPQAPLLVDDEGRALPLDGLPLRLRFARTTRVSIEGNAGLCRGLLATRYGLPVGERTVEGTEARP